MSSSDELVVVDDDIASLVRVGVDTLPPGKYLAWCQSKSLRRGRDYCGKDELRELTTTHDAFQLFTWEAAAMVFYWDDGRLHTLYWAD